MRSWQSLTLVCAMLSCAGAAANNDLKLHLTVPQDVASQAARRMAGDAGVPSPILMLHGLEFGANEGFKIEILAEPKPGATPVLLGSTAVVGHPQRTPQPPLQKVNIPVPLNEAAAQFLANHTDVTIILHFDHIDPERPPVKIDSVFLGDPGKP